MSTNLQNIIENPNIILDNGNSVLMELVVVNDIDSIKKIIDKIDINYQDLYGTTALMIACEYGYYEIVEMLIHHGADLNLLDTEGKSSLSWAVDSGNVDIVEFLANNNCNFTLLDSQLYNMLMYASRWGYLHLVKLLLTHNDSEHLNKYKESAYDIAVKAEQQQIILFYEYHKKEDSVIFTDLVTHIEQNQDSLFKMLLDVRPEIIHHQEEEEDKSLLHYAIQSKNIEFVKILVIEYNTPITQDMVDFARDTSALQIEIFLLDIYAGNLLGEKFFEAIHTENIESIAKILLQAPKLPQTHIENALPIIFHTCHNINILKLCVRAFPRVCYTKDNNGNDLLSYCIENKLVTSVAYLLAQYMDPNQVRHDGKTPLILAREVNDEQIISILLNSGARDTE